MRAHWDSKGQPLLLATLGQAAIAAGINLRTTLGDRKLADFVREELAAEIQVEPSPNAPQHPQVKPAGLNAAVGPNPETEGAVQGARLHRALWLAFSRPIAQGFLRRIQVEPVVRFWDAQPPLAEVAGRLPVGSDYIAPAAEALAPRLRDDVVLENIRRWMRDNALDISEFESGRSPSVASKPRVDPNNPLLLLIDSLDDGELKRVMLPLDVIAKLLKK